MKKSNYFIVILENIILAIIKHIVLFLSFFATYNGSYVIPPTKGEQMIIVGFGILIVILLDILINYIMYKFINKKDKNISFIKLTVISLIISFLEIISLI